jgi:hypothetical protein
MAVWELNSDQKEERSEKMAVSKLANYKKGKESRHDARRSFPFSYKIDLLRFLSFSPIGFR